MINQADLSYFISVFIKFFFLFTPFFSLSMFLSLTSTTSKINRSRIAVRTGFSVFIICVVIFFFGNYIFDIIGITLDAFKVGAGTLLFLSAIQLVQGNPDESKSKVSHDIAVVPMAMPIVIGPGTVGALLVISGDATDYRKTIWTLFAFFLASAVMGTILYIGSTIEKKLGQNGLEMSSKITGLILTALASQLILTGIGNILQISS